MKSTELNELAAALAKAQGEMHGASKDSANPFFKSNYADLASVWAACRGPLSKNGLSVTQTTTDGPDGLVLITTLMHSSGQYMGGYMAVKPVKNDPQGVGSALSYARRYALAALVGVYQVDDDAESAQGRSSPTAGFKEQPGPEDGADDTYRIPFGKFGGRRLEEVGMDDLKNYVGYLESKAGKEGKPIQGQVADFIKKAEQYVGAWENQK